MLKLGTLIILAVSLIAISAHAQSPKPSTKLPALTLPPELFYANTDPTIKAQLVSDLKMIHELTFTKTSPLHRKIFSLKPDQPAADGKNTYSKWFFQRIKKISVGNCANIDAAVACVIPILEPNKMRLTQRYLQVNAPQIARTTILFHEARHAEHNPRNTETEKDRRWWMHDFCPTPFLDENNNPRMSIWTGLPLAGMDGCDSTPEGSYGVAIVMLKNIATNSSNTNEKVKADAEIYATDQLTRITGAEAHEQLVKDAE